MLRVADPAAVKSHRASDSSTVPLVEMSPAPFRFPSITTLSVSFAILRSPTGTSRFVTGPPVCTSKVSKSAIQPCTMYPEEGLWR